MQKKFHPEFNRDVGTVARRGDPTVCEVAAGLDDSEEPVRRGVKQADVDDGVGAAAWPALLPPLGYATHGQAGRARGHITAACPRLLQAQHSGGPSDLPSTQNSM